jgi:hypothetical protein
LSVAEISVSGIHNTSLIYHICGGEYPHKSITRIILKEDRSLKTF